MKIPQIFIPDRDLDKKIEELNKLEYQKIREVTLEELMRDNMSVLCGDLKVYKRNKTLEHAFSKIVNDTFEGKISWEKDYGIPVARYKAEAIVLNYKGEGITLPVIFQIVRIARDSRDKEGFLYLGNENGPCKNSADKQIKQLAKTYFKIRNVGPRYTI